MTPLAPPAPPSSFIFILWVPQTLSTNPISSPVTVTIHWGARGHGGQGCYPIYFFKVNFGHVGPDNGACMEGGQGDGGGAGIMQSAGAMETSLSPDTARLQ